MAHVNGLEGIVAAETDLSLVDGEQGLLVYRGQLANELARTKSFEEVAHLLLYGHLPSDSEARNFLTQLRHARTLSSDVEFVLRHVPANRDIMNVLQIAIAYMGATHDWPLTPEQAIEFIAKIPTIIAYRHAQLLNKPAFEPDLALSHVENYLYMLTGEQPNPTFVRALESYLILTMEHGMNASTFAARVVTSTQSDVASALCAAVGAMKGPLHGGAPSHVMDMLSQITTIANVESWIQEELRAGKRLMGFGHRVYKTIDPRAKALRQVVETLRNNDPWFELAIAVEDAALRQLKVHKPNQQLYTNVEYWAAAILHTVEIPKELYTATFTLSRTVGWTAHILEQSNNNRLIRPQSKYVGAMPHTT